VQVGRIPIPEQLISLALLKAHPVATVLTGYILAVVINRSGYDPALYEGLSVAELLAIGVSLLFHFLVVSPSTGVESVMGVLSSSIAIALGLRTIINFID